MPARPELPTAKVRTLTLCVPRVDWAPVIAGTKTQLRATKYNTDQYGRLPMPVVLYSMQQFRAEAETRLAVLEDVSREPLGAITPEGLAAEGMADLKEFRRYWIVRHRTVGFRPLATATVYHLRLWQDGDRERFADILIDALYGPWL